MNPHPHTDLTGPHEADIDRIATLGITRGCATTPQPNVSNTSTDVAEGVWYTNYVMQFAQLCVDTGAGGAWRPDDPLTRLEMAEWLTRMFDHITPRHRPGGTVL